MMLKLRLIYTNIKVRPASKLDQLLLGYKYVPQLTGLFHSTQHKMFSPFSYVTYCVYRTVALTDNREDKLLRDHVVLLDDLALVDALVAVVDGLDHQEPLGGIY